MLKKIRQEKESYEQSRLEKKYISAIIKDDEDITESLLKSKIRFLKEIIDYKDSKVIIKTYKNYLIELRNERIKNKIKRFKQHFLRIYLPVSLVTILLYLVATIIVIPELNYSKGVDLFDSENYSDSKDYFRRNSEHKDALKYLSVIEAYEYLKINNYQKAIELMNSIDAIVNIEYDSNTNLKLGLYTVTNFPSPSREGYIFDEWEIQSYQLLKENNNFVLNLSLKSSWSKVEYVASFYSNGGPSINNIYFDIDSPDILLPIPSKKRVYFQRVVFKC